LLNAPNLCFLCNIKTIDSKLLIKLSKCILFFFSNVSRAKRPINIHGHLFPLYNILIWQKKTQMLPDDQSYTFFNIFLLTITQNAPLNSLINIINPNTPLWSYIGFFIIYSFLQNLHNIHLQATNVSNIYIPSKLNQINIFDFKIRPTHAWLWNPRLWPYHAHITVNWFQMIISSYIHAL